MTIYLHDKKPKKGMLQAAKEQGFEQAMQQVEALEAEIERLRSIAFGAEEEAQTVRKATIEECAVVAESWMDNNSDLDVRYVAQLIAAIRAMKDKG